MKLRTFILTGIAMFLFIFPSSAEVILKTSKHSVLATTTKAGVRGFKGCGINNIRHASAYKYELQKRTNMEEASACTISGKKKWKIITTESSDKNNVFFDNLQGGEYRLICFSGQATGCIIQRNTENYPDKSIEYEIEESSVFYIGKPAYNPALIETENASELLVFPNPANEAINIHFSSGKSKKEMTVALFDLYGKLVHKVSHEYQPDAKVNKWKIDTQDIQTGTYFIKIFDDKGSSFFRKIIILREQNREPLLRPTTSTGS